MEVKDDNNEEETSTSQSSENLKHQYRNMTLETLRPLLDDPKVSKNQKKKIVKQIKWLENVEERRHNRREKRKTKAQKRKEQGEPCEETSNPPPKKPRKDKISTRLNFYEHVHVAVDLSFNEYMTNIDLSKLRKQIAWCYKENRRSTHPVQYHICGLTGRLKDGMDTTYTKWDVHFDDDVYKCFKKEDMVYLTSDSDNIISEIKPGKVYIIGGLVDHNKHKGLTHKLAVENGVETGRLPLDEHIDMKTRKVLTVNHVFDVIVAFCELKDWKQALLKVIPERKGAVLVTEGST